jgi:hypothetical protein
MMQIKSAHRLLAYYRECRGAGHGRVRQARTKRSTGEGRGGSTPPWLHVRATSKQQSLPFLSPDLSSGKQTYISQEREVHIIVLMEGRGTIQNRQIESFLDCIRDF